MTTITSSIRQDISAEAQRDYRPSHICDKSLEQIIQLKVNTLFNSSFFTGFDSRMVALINKTNSQGYRYESLENRVADVAFLATYKLSLGRRFLLFFVWLFSSDSYVNKVLELFKRELQHNDPNAYRKAFEPSVEIPLQNMAL